MKKNATYVINLDLSKMLDDMAIIFCNIISEGICGANKSLGIENMSTDGSPHSGSALAIAPLGVKDGRGGRLAVRIPLPCGHRGEKGRRL